MKFNIPKLALVGMAMFTMLTACKKNDSPAPGTPPQENQRPDFTETITGSVAGYITTDDGEPIAYAEITAGDKRTSSDQYGYFAITNTNLVKSIGLVKVSSNGYYNAFKTFIPVAGKETFIRIPLQAKKLTGQIAASAGGKLVIEEKASLSLNESSVVNASNNSAFDGQIQVNATSFHNKPAGVLPGDGRGANSEGYLKTLQFYGALAVNLSSDNGTALQIAPGKTAFIQIPVTETLLSSAPSTIDLWYFNESKGLWMQEGTATRNGNVYEATVSHFSFWGVAESSLFVTLKTRITDQANNPLVHVPVSVRVAGKISGGGYDKFAYTDADGYATGAVLANANLELDVLTTCGNTAYTHSFSTQTSDINLGDIKGNLGQALVSITGTAVNCNNQPVTNGYVQTYDGGFYNRMPVVNGQFNFTGLSCINGTVNVVLIDNDNNQQNHPQSVSLSAGLNDLGELKACDISTLGFITYTLDGVTTTIAEPTDTITAILTDFNGITQVLTLSGNSNLQQKMAFQFSGGTAIGSEHSIAEIYSYALPGGRGYWPTGTVLHITEYGKVGGFVSGNFSSKLIDFDNNGLHDIECNFRIRRSH